MQFALVLVQLAIYDLPGTKQRLAIPSIPARTTNIVRGIIQVNERSEVIVTFGRLDLARPGTSNRLLTFLDELRDPSVCYEIRRTLIVRMAVGERKLLPLVIGDDGSVDTGYTPPSKELMRAYSERLAAAIPGAVLKETASTWHVRRRKSDGTPLTVWAILDHAEACRAAMEGLNEPLRCAASAQDVFAAS
jgi:hypothetical protein